MIGGSVNNNLDNEEESSMLVQDLDLDLEDDIVFKGEPLDLELISREKTSPIYLNENYEIPEKITQEIFSTEIKTNQNYKPFIKKPSNKINYYITIILSDLFIGFYEKYGIKPKKISLSKRNKYFKSIKNYMKVNAQSYEFEENDYRTFVC